MALREVLATLDVVVRGAEKVSGVNEALDKTKASSPGLVQALGQMKGAFAAIGAVIVARQIVGVLADFVQETIELGDALTDASARLGVGVSALQEWHFIAERSGISAEQMDGAIGRLNRTVGQAVRGGGSAAQQFRRLGVSLRDANGNVRATDAVFGDAITAMAGLESQQERAAVAQQLFGRTGQQLLPIISEGAEGVAALRERFHELGGGLADEVVANAAEADDAMVDFRLALQSLKGVLVANLLPAVTRIVTAVADVVGWFVELARTSSVVETALGLLVAIAAAVVVALIPAILPTLLFVAALGLLFLAVEDVVTAFRGGDSVFGRLIERIFEALGVSLTFQGALESVGLSFQAMGVVAQETFADIVEGYARVLSAVGLDPNMRRVQSARTSATRARQDLNDANVDMLVHENQRQQARREAAAPVVAPVPAPAVVERRGRGRGRAREGATRNVAQTNTFNIQGNNPQEIANVVGSVLRRQIREAAETQPVLAPEGG
jgi:hypothetical protein